MTFLNWIIALFGHIVTQLEQQKPLQGRDILISWVQSLPGSESFLLSGYSLASWTGRHHQPVTAISSGVPISSFSYMTHNLYALVR